MCRAPEIERTEFYVWLAEPLSPRAKDNAELIAQIKQYWLESGCVYGYRNITKDMREGDFASARGYKRHPGLKGGLLSAVASNTLNREFEVDAPNKVWVTDFTYIRTHEGWLYLTVVLDLFSRQVIGWSMKSNPRSDLVIDARMMAMWRRKPKEKVLVHSESCSC